jgi:hypothetical protein
MKMIAIVLALFYAPIQAQTISCPPTYPPKDIVIPDQAPHGFGGGMVMADAKLSGAGMFLNDPRKGELIGDYRKTKTGWEISYKFEPKEVKWLVCYYGKSGEVRRFETMDSTTKDCLVTAINKKDQVSIAATCK